MVPFVAQPTATFPSETSRGRFVPLEVAPVPRSIEPRLHDNKCPGSVSNKMYCAELDDEERDFERASDSTMTFDDDLPTIGSTTCGREECGYKKLKRSSDALLD